MLQLFILMQCIDWNRLYDALDPNYLPIHNENTHCKKLNNFHQTNTSKNHYLQYKIQALI